MKKVNLNEAAEMLSMVSDNRKFEQE